MPPEPIVLDAPADLATGGTAELFRGADHGIDVSFFLNHAAPGSGAEAHRHPYAEVFVVLDGDVAFTVEGRDHAARGGHVVVVPAGAAHAFRNAGDGTLGDGVDPSRGGDGDRMAGGVMSLLERSAAVTGPLVGAAFLGGVGTAVKLSDHPYPRPGADADAIRTYFTDGARGARVSATGQLVSATALAAFSGAVASFARRSGRPRAAPPPRPGRRPARGRGRRGRRGRERRAGGVRPTRGRADDPARRRPGPRGRPASPRVPRGRADARRRLRAAARRARPRGAARRRAPAPAGRRRGRGGGAEPARAALPRRGARGLVHPDGTVPRADRHGRRGRAHRAGRLNKSTRGWWTGRELAPQLALDPRWTTWQSADREADCQRG